MSTRRLPFETFSEIAALGLEVHVWCTSCHAHRIVPLSPAHAERRFAGARFRCTRQVQLYSAVSPHDCNGLGRLSIEPAQRINPASSVHRVHLWCMNCRPAWQIVDVRLDQPPWSEVPLGRGDQFQCPACGRAVGMDHQGGPGIPYTEGYRA